MRIKARLERVMSIFPPELKKKQERNTPKNKNVCIYIFFFSMANARSSSVSFKHVSTPILLRLRAKLTV